ncbi:glycosyltransferase [Conexibacter sp. CPCC 206217]|uniref:glycosyltransferase n=1 Tax=Conexibacter sp. CPCC 206217 TaxID=3064574 RepID=UPI0027170509|nr:glycosyltransferase [Conexibacter sp. CPCC 206217]MDO8213374.1 glycosyltransferase [Conexibacter sp. CPCC 206217]
MSKLGVQRAIGLPECATPPAEVYALARRRGMDFVTITDHDTIEGCLELERQGLPGVFTSVELTTWFRHQEQAVHVLCWGITPDDHDWLQAHAKDVETIAAYLHGNEIACALAHPFYAVAAPLTARHRRRLAQLFPVWEVRNGSRAPELNAPAAVYIETHGGTGVGGSDDHAGVDVGRTFTQAPPAATPEQFLAHLRAGNVSAHGRQGSAAKWTHAAIALAARSIGADREHAPDPFAVLQMAERMMSEGEQRGGEEGTGLGPDDGRRLLRAWLDALGFEPDADALIARMQAEDFSHSDLARRARRVHERRLAAAVDRALHSAGDVDRIGAVGLELFEALLPIVPYIPAQAFLAREKEKLDGRERDPIRVALVADGVGSMHGVTHTLDEIRERGLPGFEVEVVGTDPNVDRRLPAVAEVDVPFYPGLEIGVPSLPDVAEALTSGNYDLVHLVSPGPAGIAAALLARLLGLPVVGSYHTELGAYARLRTADERIEAAVGMALAVFYGQCGRVLSPSRAADASLAELGIEPDKIGRWDRGVDLERFSPALRERAGDGEIVVLYAGRLTREKGVDLLADTFERAHARDPRLRLALAGGGPEQATLRERLGDSARFLGWLDGDALAHAYANADLFLFASETDTFGQVILEAQASGLPVLSVDVGGPRELIAHGRSGWLCPPDADALADALIELADHSALRARLTHGGLDAVRDRSWTAALGQLADGYTRALATAETAARRAA